MALELVWLEICVKRDLVFKILQKCKLHGQVSSSSCSSKLSSNYMCMMRASQKHVKCKSYTYFLMIGKKWMNFLESGKILTMWHFLSHRHELYLCISKNLIQPYPSLVQTFQSFMLQNYSRYIYVFLEIIFSFHLVVTFITLYSKGFDDVTFLVTSSWAILMYSIQFNLFNTVFKLWISKVEPCWGYFLYSQARVYAKLGLLYKNVVLLEFSAEQELRAAKSTLETQR